MYVLGYYCPSGSKVETEIICPIGKHCPTGSSDPQDCVAGTYAEQTGLAACNVCPEGMNQYCKCVMEIFSIFCKL